MRRKYDFKAILCPLEYCDAILQGPFLDPFCMKCGWNSHGQPCNEENDQRLLARIGKSGGPLE